MRHKRLLVIDDEDDIRVDPLTLGQQIKEVLSWP